MRRITKTVFVTDDKMEFDTEVEARAWERYAHIRHLLEEGDFDWRDGTGPDAANPDTIAKYLSERLLFEPRPGVA